MPDKVRLEIKRTREKLCAEDGTPILVCSFDTPFAEGVDGFNSFYQKIREKCLNFCKNKLVLHGVQGKIYSYSMRCKTTVDGGRVTVTLKTIFTDKTSLCKLDAHTETHIWNFDLMKIKVIK